MTPGFLRSEAMLERFGVTETNWQQAGKKDKNFLQSETPLFVGRAVVALACDPAILDRSGQLLCSWELGRQYRLRDADGRRPNWGAAKIDFSRHPQMRLDLMRDGAEIQLQWLNDLTRRTRDFRRRLPRAHTFARSPVRHRDDTGCWSTTRTFASPRNGRRSIASPNPARRRASESEEVVR
jgi:hypothetical protein